MVRAIIIDPSDNVASLTEDGRRGEAFDDEVKGEKLSVRLKSNIPFGHKFAIRAIAKDALIIKYGRPIGAATESIEPGAHVHVHNCAGLRGRGDLGGGKRS
jgi:altronate dehydratase small subunit